MWRIGFQLVFCGEIRLHETVTVVVSEENSQAVIFVYVQQNTAAESAPDIFKACHIDLGMSCQSIQLIRYTLFWPCVFSNVGMTVQVKSDILRKRLQLAQDLCFEVASGKRAVDSGDHFISGSGDLFTHPFPACLSIGIQLLTVTDGIMGGEPTVVGTDVIAEEKNSNHRYVR